MIPAIWKSAALAGVVGVGCGGVWYVQRDLATTAPLEPGRFSELDPAMKGDPAPALTGADPIELPGPPPSSVATQPVATASLQSADPGTASLETNETPPEQTEPKDEPAAEEPAADSLLALVNPAAEASGNPWAKRPGVGAADAVEAPGAAAPKASVAPASAPASDPWGDLPGLEAGKAAPKSQPSKSTTSAPIDLVANPDEGRSVDGAHDAKLQALPPEHPGPVLMEVPKGAPKQTASANELFLPEIGDQSEPAPGQEIQQVQNQLPEIRPRSRSTIPTAGAEPQAANPFYERQPMGAGGAESLPEIRPAAGASAGTPPQTAIVPASDLNPAPQPAAGSFAPSPFGAGSPATNSPNPAAGAAPRSGNPFEFVPAGVPGAAPTAAPAQAPEPTPANPFAPAAADPAKAPVRSTIPGQNGSGGEVPSKFSLPPAQPEASPAAVPNFAPAAAPATSAPGNRDAIPELQGGVFGVTAPASPSSNGTQVPVGNAAPAGSNPLGNPGSPLGSPADVAPVRREPVVDLVGDGTVASTVTPGPQQPEIKIEKVAPAEAVIGEPLVYQIFVRNVGQSTAHRVIVEDRIPLGATCQGTIPQAETAEKRLFWKLGNMRPGEEREIKIKLTPTQAGSIGSVATVSFAAEVAATTMITAPELKVDLQAPRQVIIGEASTLRIRVQNTGQGQAKGVFLRALLPNELKHPGGNDLEYEIGNLAPGQAKDVELHVTAEKGGNLTPKVIVSTNNQEQDSRIAQMSAIDTRLKVVRTGPAKRFVGRPAQYLNTVTNQSLDTVRDVSVVETLPRDLEPVQGKLSNGQWDPQNRTITWRLPQLAPGENVELPIDLIPKKPGAFDGSLQVADASGNRANVATHVDVAGYSNLVVDVVPDGPVAVGEQVSMRLSVRNRGTAAASNVQTVFEVPPHLKFVNASGPVQHQAAGNVVHFAALDVLPPGAEQEFDIILTAAQEGDARVKVDLYSDDHKTQPLHEEGEVRVYRDQNVRPAVSESFVPGPPQPIR